MANNVNVKKLEADLWESADLLRAGSKLTSNQYCMPVLGLIFLRYAYSRFKLVEQEILKDRPVRGGRVLPVEQSDFAEKSALFLPKEAQYNYLVNLPANIPEQGLTGIEGNPLNSLGEVVNNAMELVEQQSEQLQGVLPKDYTIFSDELLGELLRIFNNDALDDVGGDVIGRIYEYFLNKFAKNVAQDDGVFFTPKSLVKMIVNVLEPAHGVLLDPACGSGGMFVQTGDFVNHAGMIANNTMTFYGQEKVEYNAKLCLMNMAVHGLTGVIKSGDEANTFYHDAHNLNGCCDYVMANPPFNVDKVKSESAQSAGRLPFGLPGVNKAKEIGNANYLWVSYFYSYLNEHGRAGFVMASSATDSQGKDKDIREKLIQTGHVDVMVSVGNNFFYTKSLPCSLWFLDKGKPEHLLDTVLFIDARNYYTTNKLEILRLLWLSIVQCLIILNDCDIFSVMEALKIKLDWRIRIMSVKTGENVFTRKYDKLMFRYPVKVVLGTGENEEIVEGVIDTGSPVCGVTKRLADKFGLKKLGATSVSPAFGGKSERMLYCVDFLLEDCLRFSDMRATEIEKGYDGAEFIVGCNVLCLGDFVITNKDRKTTISLRLPSDKEIDFMVE